MVVVAQDEHIVFVGLSTKMFFGLEKALVSDREFKVGEVYTAIQVALSDPFKVVPTQNFKELFRYTMAPMLSNCIIKEIASTAVKFISFLKGELKEEVIKLDKNEIYLKTAVCISFIDWSKTNDIKEAIFQCPTTGRRGKIWEKKNKRGRVQETFKVGATYGSMVINTAAWGDKKDTTWNGPEDNRANKIIVAKSKFAELK